jgi:hypothetical protein
MVMVRRSLSPHIRHSTTWDGFVSDVKGNNLTATGGGRRRGAMCWSPSPIVLLFGNLMSRILGTKAPAAGACSLLWQFLSDSMFFVVASFE